MNRDKISIHPDISPHFLFATVEGFGGMSYQVRINLKKKYFVAVEWRSKENRRPYKNLKPRNYGSFEEFKQELYQLKIWEWDPMYRKDEGIILDGQYWSVKLKTEDNVYESMGAQAFPPNWKRFCKAIEKLTGAPFH